MDAQTSADQQFLALNRKLSKPLLIFDGDCGFCRFWVNAWQKAVSETVNFAPFQEVASEFPDIPLDKFKQSVQLIISASDANRENITNRDSAETTLTNRVSSAKSDSRAYIIVYSGAEAVFRLLAFAPGQRWLLWCYLNIPGFALLSEFSYKFIAEHRLWLSKLSANKCQLDHLSPRSSSYSLTSWLFLRLIGLIYFIAFLSLTPQITGLIGAQGILPAQSLLQVMGNNLGPERYWLLPTLSWLNTSDSFLQLLGWGGAALSLLVVLDVATGPVLLVLWLFYLSLVTVGRNFLSFQWDALLLETGFLCIFFAPWTRPRPSPPSLFILWLLRWLLFRLMFMSGAVKLLSGDPTWHNLTALSFHWYTQPLPTPLAWYVAQLPLWFDKLAVIAVFLFELVVPFFIFGSHQMRLIAALALCLFQLLIAATGNYAFFNLLTIALCVLLLDDAYVQKFCARLISKFIPKYMPKFIAEWFIRRSAIISSGTSNTAPSATPPKNARSLHLAQCSAACLTVVLIYLGVTELFSRFAVIRNWAEPVLAPAEVILGYLAPFHIVNSYGLFAVMTTTRHEIIIEGSYNGKTWLAYEFKYKPGDLRRAPPWVSPYQPRLDWQMWFVALSNYQNNPWFINFIVRLLEGSPEVLALLDKNPFPNAPPLYIRALVYEYRFTDFATQKPSGAWWQRQLQGVYLPTLSLKSY